MAKQAARSKTIRRRIIRIAEKGDTCTGRDEVLEHRNGVGYGCTKEAALRDMLGKLLTVAETGRKNKCDSDASCGAQRECATTITNLSDIEARTTYAIVRLRNCRPDGLGYEAFYAGALKTACVCVPAPV